MLIWWSEIRRAMRRLVRSPRYAVSIAVPLGLALGAASLALRTVDALFLRPPAAVRTADQLVRVYVERTDNAALASTTKTSYPVFLSVQEGLRSLATFAACYQRESMLGRGEAALLMRGAPVSNGYFGVLGVSAYVGRLLDTIADPQLGRNCVVISH